MTLLLFLAGLAAAEISPLPALTRDATDKNFRDISEELRRVDLRDGGEISGPLNISSGVTFQAASSTTFTGDILRDRPCPSGFTRLWNVCIDTDGNYENLIDSSPATGVATGFAAVDSSTLNSSSASIAILRTLCLVDLNSESTANGYRLWIRQVGDADSQVDGQVSCYARALAGGNEATDTGVAIVVLDANRDFEFSCENNPASGTTATGQCLAYLLGWLD